MTHCLDGGHLFDAVVVEWWQGMIHCRLSAYDSLPTRSASIYIHDVVDTVAPKRGEDATPFAKSAAVLWCGCMFGNPGDAVPSPIIQTKPSVAQLLLPAAPVNQCYVPLILRLIIGIWSLVRLTLRTITYLRVCGANGANVETYRVLSPVFHSRIRGKGSRLRRLLGSWCGLRYSTRARRSVDYVTK